MNESKRFSLNRIDLEKIGTGLLIALGGAFLTYVSKTLVSVDFGDYTPIVVALNSVLINAGRKFLASHREVE